MAEFDYLLGLTDIGKKYSARWVLERVNLQVKKNDLLGIIGPNASGKSTLLKIILQLIVPSAGKMYFLAPGKIRVAGLLEKPGFYPDFTIAKNLRLFSASQPCKVEIDQVLSEMKLNRHRDTKFKNCSMGVKRRAELASILLYEPHILVLDEPSNGLDPTGIIDLRNILKRFHDEGRTIIMTSHNLNELEKICSRICFIHKGVIRECGDKEMFLKKFNDLEDAYRYYTK